VDWRKPNNKAVSLIGLITQADHQLRLWTSLEALSEKPGDRALQESFWELVNQKKDPVELLPAPENPAATASLEKLNDGWKFIKQCSQSQLEIWKERQGECKSTLEHAQAPMPDVWRGWGQAEIGQWQYLNEKIKTAI
jgi:hypothetical protein